MEGGFDENSASSSSVANQNMSFFKYCFLNIYYFALFFPHSKRRFSFKIYEQMIASPTLDNSWLNILNHFSTDNFDA